MARLSLISIIIPTFNREDLIAETLDSVLVQSSSNWECIVVDDGSTDNTWNVLRKYAERNNRIKIFKRERIPKGAPTCRNIGAAQAAGDYFIFLDSDDLLMPWAIKDRLLFTSKNPKTQFFLSQGLDFYKNGKVFFRGNPREKDYVDAFISFQRAFQTSAPTWNRRFFEKVGQWNESLNRWQDPEIHIRALLKKPKIKWVSEVPDYMIRYDNIDENKITNSQKVFGDFDKLIEGYGNILKLLDEKHKKMFQFYVKNQAWHFGCYLNKSQLALVSSALFKFGFINEQEAKKYYSTCVNYFRARRIPFLRKLFYHKISKNLVKVETYKVYKDQSVIEIFIDKLNKHAYYDFVKKILSVIKYE